MAKRRKLKATKGDLVKITAREAGVTCAVSRGVIDSMLRTIMATVCAGGVVELRRFGIFQQRKVRGRTTEGKGTFNGKPVSTTGTIKLGFKVGTSYRTNLHVTGQ